MARLLIVDDEAPVRASLRRTLERAGHSVVEAACGGEARAAVNEVPHLMLCDINMPDESGLALVRWLHENHPDIAVVMLTGVDDPDIARVAVELGAYAYLIKPTTPNEVLINVTSALRRHELEVSRREYVIELESKLITRGTAIRDLLKKLDESRVNTRQAEGETVGRLVTALTLRSEETGAHIIRMARYAGVLNRHQGIDLWTEEELRLATMLHDVGKIGIPDAILLKPGPLTGEEFDVIRRHPALGHTLLVDGQARVLTLGARIALTHHERWDGTGYPNGLAGEEIPIEGRIAAVADVFDALTSDRVYRKALSIEQAADIVRGERGRHFDPELVELFLVSLEELVNIRTATPDDDIEAAWTAP